MLVVGGTILVGEGIEAFVKTDAGKWVGDQIGKGYDDVTEAVGDAGSWVGHEATSAWDWAFG